MPTERTLRSPRVTWSALARLADEAGWEFSLIISEGGKVVRSNAAVVRVVRREEGSVVGTPFSEIVRKPDGKLFGSALLHPRSRSNPLRRQFSIVSGDGRLVPCGGVAFYFEGHRGGEGGLLLLGRRFRKAHCPGPDVPGARCDIALMTAVNDGILVMDAEGMVIEANAVLGAMAGRAIDTLPGTRAPYPWFDPAENRRFAEVLATVVGSGEPAHLLVVLGRDNGAPLALSASIARHPAVPENLVASLRDISDIVPARESQMTGRRIERLSEQLQRNSLRLKSLQEINQAVLRSGSLSTVFRRITDGVRRLVDHDLAGIYVFDGEEKFLRPHTLSRATSFSRRLGRFPITPGDGIIGSAALTGETVLVNDAQHDPRSTYPPGMKPPVEHIIAAPLRGRESTYGILTVARNRHPGFNEEDALIVKSFADAASIAIDNIRLHADLIQAGGPRRRSSKGLRSPLVSPAARRNPADRSEGSTPHRGAGPDDRSSAGG